MPVLNLRLIQFQNGPAIGNCLWQLPSVASYEFLRLRNQGTILNDKGKLFFFVNFYGLAGSPGSIVLQKFYFLFL